MIFHDPQTALIYQNVSQMFFSHLSPEQFSMPIQCTEDTVEQAEVSFSPALRPEVCNVPPPLASRGAGPDDLFDSLKELSVKFPPSPTEYEFLNSTPDKRMELPVLRPDLEDHIHPVGEESYPSYPVHSSHSSSASSASQEGVRGPQQVRGMFVRTGQIKHLLSKILVKLRLVRKYRVCVGVRVVCVNV